MISPFNNTSMVETMTLPWYPQKYRFLQRIWKTLPQAFYTAFYMQQAPLKDKAVFSQRWVPKPDPPVPSPKLCQLDSITTKNEWASMWLTRKLLNFMLTISLKVKNFPKFLHCLLFRAAKIHRSCSKMYEIRDGNNAQWWISLSNLFFKCPYFPNGKVPRIYKNGYVLHGETCYGVT